MSDQGLEVFLDELATSNESVTQAASLGRAEVQDVIQITEESHPWFGCLLIVAEVTLVGVKAYLPQVGSENGTQNHYSDFSFQQFQRIGRAVVLRP
ncbi:hypothetical protein [Hymenobacter cavernae]|uniref:Uncharacterized protein n=1 Tax=Hymenobacter cavernae TaxID=2044852 RepID=A0ABQ1U4J6_9BACT|nr:hypothetical protein [Hymenobacter cavernae]GGF10388.1 hypothetical protein GCM10011383_21970 [Hymenobacter cavernae]